MSEQIAKEALRALYERARAAAERAYAPYSRFRVGAAILAESGASICSYWTAKPLRKEWKGLKALLQGQKLRWKKKDLRENIQDTI